MNRTITRLFGFCVAILGINTTGLQTAYAGIQEKLPDNCKMVGSKRCHKRAFYTDVTCTLTGSGFISYDLAGQYPECDNSGKTVPFRRCFGGWCNDKFVFCDDPNFFEYMGCVNSGNGSCNFAPTNLYVTGVSSGYFFTECTTGYYEILGGGTGWSYSLDSLESNCAPCSGLRFQNGAFETHSDSSGTAGNAQFSWDSDGVDIYSCWAKPSSAGMTLTNSMGTFEITAPCPYSSGS